MHHFCATLDNCMCPGLCALDKESPLVSTLFLAPQALGNTSQSAVSSTEGQLRSQSSVHRQVFFLTQIPHFACFFHHLTDSSELAAHFN